MDIYTHSAEILSCSIDMLSSTVDICTSVYSTLTVMGLYMCCCRYGSEKDCMSDARCDYGDDYLTTTAPCTALLPQVSVSVAHIIYTKSWNNDHSLTLSAQIHTLSADWRIVQTH